MAQRRETQDRYFKQAKAEGYAARSAYKLIEINRKRPVLKRGDRVADLGCSPGSWVQIASEIVGDRGLVVGIDLKPVTIQLPPNARTVVADVFSVTAEDLLNLAEGRDPTADGGAAPQAHRSAPRALFDAVLSDMAPSTEGGGGGATDHFRSIDLCRRVLDLLPRLLKPGGRCVMKVFEGEAYPELLKDTGRMFAEVKGFKPESSRDVSREMFIIATGYRPPAPTNADQGPARGDSAGVPPSRSLPRPREGWGA